MVEVIIKVKDSERTLTQRFMQEETFSMSHDDPIIHKMVNETLKDFQGTPEDIIIKVIMDW